MKFLNNMPIYNQPRGSGKTTRLIYESAIKHIPILCISRVTCEGIKGFAQNNHLDIPSPICIYDILNANPEHRRRISEATKDGYLIDEGIDMFRIMLMHHGVGQNIEAITLSYPEE